MIDVSFQRAELKVKIADLATALADARMSVLDAQQEIIDFRGQIQQLEARADVRSGLRHKNNAYYLQDGDRESGPYCVACFEREEQLVPLSKLPVHFQSPGSTHQCPGCRAIY